MPLREMKVAPATKNNSKEKHLCLCEVLAPILIIAKLVGLFPLTSTHQGGRCVYQKSWYWIAYTAGLASFYLYQLLMNFDYIHILSNKGFMQILRDIVNLLFAYCMLLLLLLSFLQIPKYIKFFDKMSDVFKDGIFCQSARRVALLTDYILTVFTFIIMIVQIGMFHWLSQSTNFETSILTYIFELQFSQNISVMFYCSYASIISVLLGTLACFEKLLMASVQSVPVHPVKGISDNDNRRTLLGIFKFRLCKSDHVCPSGYSLLSRAELVEYLRIFHQDICSAIYYYNDCMNPAFLFHTVVELIAIIIDYYAMVAYLVYDFSDPLSRPNHFISTVSGLLHTVGLYLFLKNGQHMKNMVHALNNILLEYSTRVSDDDEHLQIRIFIEKLKQHSPFTASGVFNIDVSIAGSISANILTYVLVALQFEIPKL